MDHLSLLNALTTALEIAPQADETDYGLFSMLYRVEHEPSHADQRLVRLLEQLRRTPELEIFNGGMEALPGVASAVTYPALARWLLARAAQVGGEQTLDNLHQFLAASVLPYRMTLALGGITLDFSCTLA